MNHPGRTRATGGAAPDPASFSFWRWLVAHPVAATALVATPTLAISIALAIATLWAHAQFMAGDHERLHTCTSACTCSSKAGNAAATPGP